MGTGVTAQPLRTRIALKKELNSVANIHPLLTSIGTKFVHGILIYMQTEHSYTYKCK